MAKTVRRVKRKTGRKTRRKYSRCKTKKRVKRKYNRKSKHVKRSYKKRSRERIIQDGGMCTPNFCSRVGAEEVQNRLLELIQAGKQLPDDAVLVSNSNYYMPGGRAAHHCGGFEQEVEMVFKIRLIAEGNYSFEEKKKKFNLSNDENINSKPVDKGNIYSAVVEGGDLSLSLDDGLNPSAQLILDDPYLKSKKIKNDREYERLMGDTYRDEGRPAEEPEPELTDPGTPMQEEEKKSTIMDLIKGNKGKKHRQRSGETTPLQGERADEYMVSDTDTKPDQTSDQVRFLIRYNLLPKGTTLTANSVKIYEGVEGGGVHYTDREMKNAKFEVVSGGDSPIDVWTRPTYTLVYAQKNVDPISMNGKILAKIIIGGEGNTHGHYNRLGKNYYRFEGVVMETPSPDTIQQLYEKHQDSVLAGSDEGGHIVVEEEEAQVAVKGAEKPGTTDPPPKGSGKKKRVSSTEHSILLHPSRGSIVVGSSQSLLPQQRMGASLEPGPRELFYGPHSAGQQSSTSGGVVVVRNSPPRQTKNEMKEEIKSLGKRLEQAIAAQSGLLGPGESDRSDDEHLRIGGIVQDLYERLEGYRGLKARYPPNTLKIEKMIVKQGEVEGMEMRDVPYYHKPSKGFYAYALNKRNYRDHSSSTPELLILPQESIAHLYHNRDIKITRNQPIILTQGQDEISLYGVSCTYEKL